MNAKAMSFSDDILESIYIFLFCAYNPLNLETIFHL